MGEFDLATFAAWCAVAAAILWIAGPPIATLCGWTRIRYEVEAIGVEHERAWLAPLARQLTQAGLAPLGRLRIRIRFNGPHWRATITEYLFAADDTLIGVYRLQSFGKPSFGASSLFTDGLVFQTGASMPDIKVEEPHYHRKGIATSDPLELLAAHREHIQMLVHRGATLVPPRTLEVSRQIVETEWSTVYARSQLRDLARAVLTIFGFLLFAGVVMAWTQSTWLASALAILAVFGIQQGLALAAIVFMTVASWMKKENAS